MSPKYEVAAMPEAMYGDPVPVVKKERKPRTRTALGKELAKIRIDNDETLEVMASKLMLRNTQLSRLETGSLPLTAQIAKTIEDVYDISTIQYLGEVSGKITIDLTTLSESERAEALYLHCKSVGLSPPKLKLSSGITPGVLSTGRISAVIPPVPTERIYDPNKPRLQVLNVPDVEGVDFLDDDDMDDLEGDD